METLSIDELNSNDDEEVSMSNGAPDNKQGSLATASTNGVATVAPIATITGEYSSFDMLLKRTDVADFGYAIDKGFFKANGGAVVNAFGEADLLALDQARVYGSGHARIDATDESMIIATDQVKVTASGASTILATGYAKVYASDTAVVAAMDGSEVYASGRVRIKAFGCSTVYASGESQVEVSEPTQCLIYLYGNAKMISIPAS